MTRLTLLTFAALATPSLAIAGSPTPLPGHEGHWQCHFGDISKHPECPAILTAEKTAEKSYIGQAPVDAVVLADGTRKLGRRTAFDRKTIHALTTEDSFSGLALASRTAHVADDASVRGADYEDGSIGSCDEFTYKRYYGANRELDTLANYTNQRRYNDAVDAILYGIPAVGTAKGVWPLDGVQLLDFDNHFITNFAVTGGGAAKKALAPQYPGGASNLYPRNVFFGLPQFLALHAPADDTAFWNAFNQSWHDIGTTKAYVTYPSDGEFGYARDMRTNADIASLQPGEQEDVASRITAMRDALAAASHQYNQCLTQVAISDTANANLAFGKTAAELAKFLEQNQPGAGYTYPVDYADLQAQSLLLDPATSASTAQSIIHWDGVTQGAIANLAKTRTGQLLHLIANIDSTAAAQAVAQTTFTVKSGAIATPACSLGDTFSKVATLLEQEYARGDAGCMSANRRCDFSAPVFVDDIAGRLTTYVADADDAKAACVQYIGPNFNSKTNQISAADRATVSSLSSLLNQRYLTLGDILRDAPRNSQLPNSIGDRRDGGATWGDKSLFAADYSYSSEWGFNPSRTGPSGVCQIGGTLAASLKANAYAFGSTKHLVDAALRANTPQPATLAKPATPATYSAHVTVNDEELFTPVVNASLDDFSPDGSGDEERESVTIVHTFFAIGPIPVSLDVSAGFDYGYNLNITYDQSSGCVDQPTLALIGSVTPHAGADVTLTVAVDILIASAGFKGVLTLLDASLPFTASVSTKYDGNNLTVSAKSSLDLVLQELKGSISVFISIIGITVYEQELFSWAGLKQTIHLWGASIDLPGYGFSSL